MKPIHSSWYFLSCMYGGAVVATVNPLAGIATAVTLYHLYKSRKAVEEAEREIKTADQQKKFKEQFYARQNFESYDDYLGSHVWREKRARVVARAMGRCEHGDCTRAVDEVHHMRYPRIWGNEPIDWLVALCEEHHREVHGHDTQNLKRGN